MIEQEAKDWFIEIGGPVWAQPGVIQVFYRDGQDHQVIFFDAVKTLYAKGFAPFATMNFKMELGK